MMKFNILFFLALSGFAKGARGESNSTNLVHLLHQNLTDTCVALGKFSAMNCNCADLANSSAFGCQYEHNDTATATATGPVVEECVDDWTPGWVPCYERFSMDIMSHDEDAGTGAMEICVEYNREG